MEALWWLVRALLFLVPLPLPNAFRVGLLRLFGAELGSGVVIRHGVNISFPWRFKCGSHVWLGENSRFLSLAEIRLGSHVCISQEAFLCTGTHDYRSPGFDLRTAPIEVEDECWVGARAFLGPGIRVGTGSVVGACAVVTKDIPANHLVFGNPGTIRPLANPEC